MKLVIEPMNTLPCRLEVFAINGKNANQNDFVYAYDHDIENAETDTCSDMHFDPKPPTKEVLNRYNITDKEYYDICNELESELYVGRCGWCV